MWLDFSLSSVERGWRAVAQLGGRKAFDGRSVLDVGCAYGGFLVASKEAGARRAVGIDINPQLLDLARMQIADHRLKAEILQADITSPGIANRLGAFDIVLCNDVIEHVVEPMVCAANLASLLKRGGKVFLEIPNGSAVDFMLRDGHYGLFGITLLGREPAERWWRHHYSDTYGVEHYATVPYYMQIFSAAGISLRLLSGPADQEGRLGEVTEAFDRLEKDLESFDKPEAPELVAAIHRRGSEEIGRFRQLRARIDETNIPAERAILVSDVVNTYGTTFWTLEGTKL
jgi:SAM-dependent methyltransferase